MSKFMSGGNANSVLSAYATEIKKKLTQVATMPTAAVGLLGQVVQYIGTTSGSYTNGYFYKCVSDGASTPTYSWQRINIQPSGSGVFMITLSGEGTQADPYIVDKTPAEVDEAYNAKQCIQLIDSRLNEICILKDIIMGESIIGYSFDCTRIMIRSTGNDSSQNVVISESVILYVDTSSTWENIYVNEADVPFTQVTEFGVVGPNDEGRAFQYMGTTNSHYTHGYFYECVSDGAVSPTYSWKQLNVQPNGLTQYTTMPAPSQNRANEIVQYVGTSVATEPFFGNAPYYIPGEMYKCVLFGSESVYYWEPLYTITYHVEEVNDDLPFLCKFQSEEDYYWYEDDGGRQHLYCSDGSNWEDVGYFEVMHTTPTISDFEERDADFLGDANAIWYIDGNDVVQITDNVFYATIMPAHPSDGDYWLPDSTRVYRMITYKNEFGIIDPFDLYEDKFVTEDYLYDYVLPGYLSDYDLNEQKEAGWIITGINETTPLERQAAFRRIMQWQSDNEGSFSLPIADNVIMFNNYNPHQAGLLDSEGNVVADTTIDHSKTYYTPTHYFKRGYFYWVDISVSTSDISRFEWHDIDLASGKADKVSSATNGNFAGLDSNGNLTDSGSKASDFATNFSGVSFTSGNNNSGEHNANNCITNGVYYYTSNGPSTSIGASTDDGALYVQAYSDSWVVQIAQDYRNGFLFVRSKNNGTWTDWKCVTSTALNRSTAVTVADTNYTTAMARAIYATTTDPGAGATMTNGTICLVYE